MGDHDGFDSDTDEVDERRHLKAYWRADEGKGNTVHDVSDQEMHLISKDQGL